MTNIIKILAATGAEKAQDGLKDVNTGGNSTDLTAQIALIINSIIGVIGIISVVVIILGGITYSTSQGDPSKVKKGKDTILYGVIGLIVSLLAFAIVNFVIQALQG